MNTLLDLRRASDAQRTAVEARFAVRVGAALNDANDALPHDISERLRHAREQALVRARASRTAVAPVAETAQVWQWMRSGRSALAWGSTPEWAGKVLSVLPALALALGLILIDDWHQTEQVMAAVDVDAALLADELPPDAYTDPGFLEYLKTAQQ
jgi:hypothetical protein